MLTSFATPMFTEDHTWVRLDQGSEIARVGVTGFLAERLAQLREVHLPHTGEQVRQLSACGLLSTGYWAGDLFAPVSGVVATVNQRVRQNPALVYRDPYEHGWLFDVRLSTPPRDLLDGLAYLELTSQRY